MAVPVEDRPTPRTLVPPTVSAVLMPYITAAATLTAASGIAGTLDSTPTAAECQALMITGTWDADLDIREVTVSMSNHSGKACGGGRIVLGAGDSVVAADELVSSTGSALSIRPGDAFSIPVSAADPDHASVTRMDFVWVFAAGTGYADVEVEIMGVSYA